MTCNGATRTALGFYRVTRRGQSTAHTTHRHVFDYRTERAPCWDVFFSGSRPLREMVEVIELRYGAHFGASPIASIGIATGRSASTQSQLESSAANRAEIYCYEGIVYPRLSRNTGQIQPLPRRLAWGVVRARSIVCRTRLVRFSSWCACAGATQSKYRALALKGDFDLSAAFSQLQNEHLIKARFSKFPDAFDAYHNRIGAAGLSEIEPTRMRELHLALATPMNERGRSIPRPSAPLRGSWS